MQRVLDSPVASDGLCEPGSGTRAGCDVIANVEPGAILQFGPRFDPDDCARVDEADFAGKAPVAVEPIDLPQHRDGAGFDAAVTLVEIDVGLDLALIGGLEGGLDIGLQGRLIAFDGEQIVGADVADGFCDVRIAGDGVDGDHGAVEAAAGREFLEQHRDRARFVGFVLDRLLPENQAPVDGEGGDQMQRGPSLGPIVAAAHGLAVDGDHVERIGPAGARPVHEAGGEQVRIDPVHHDIEPAPRGNAPVERQEPLQELEMGLSPIGDGVETVALGDRGANA